MKVAILLGFASAVVDNVAWLVGWRSFFVSNNWKFRDVTHTRSEVFFCGICLFFCCDVVFFFWGGEETGFHQHALV